MLGFGLVKNLTALALAAIIAAPTYATETMAQATEEDWQLLNRIVEVSNFISPETAREGHKRCLELRKEVMLLPRTVPTAQRFYFEAEIESCIAYAMNNGKYSDETGDECSHHFEFARLLRESIKLAQNMVGVMPEQLTNLRDRLQRASELGPQLGCKGDYAGLIASLPAVDAVVSTQGPGVPDEEFLGRIINIKYAITADRPNEWLAACREFEAEIERREDLHDAERAYFAALVEDCIARTMVMGNVSDRTGDACVHHHLYATNLSLSLQLDKDAPFFNDDFRQFVLGELAVTLQQGPGMGCTQDYEALRINRAS